MKFINFNQEARNCLSERQKRRFHEIENHILENNEDLADPSTKQLYIVCLSYDEGIRYNITAWLYNEPDIPRYVVVDSEISCDCVAIQYSKSRGHWVFSIKPDIKFKALEDAIKAALLCKGKKTYLERLQIIAENFPEFAADIADEIKMIEEINNPDYSV